MTYSGVDQSEDFRNPKSSLHPEGLPPTRGVLRQAFAHCAMFVTAALRGGPDSVSVPMLRANLSVPLPVDALVSRYLTNKLIGTRPLPRR